MSYQFSMPELPLKLKIVSSIQPASSVSIDLVSAPEKRSPDLPGSQVGDSVVIKSGEDLTVLFSLGKNERTTPETYRQAGGAAGKWLRQSGAQAVDFRISTQDYAADPLSLQAFLEGLLLGAYQFRQYKQDKSADKPILVNLRVEESLPELKKMIERTVTLAAIIYLERNWAHEPANVINPLTLAERVSAMAKFAGLKCTILDTPALEAMGAGGIVNVGKGSQTPPQMIVLEYTGSKPEAGAKPTVLVGKALTFDTGGYSLKNTEAIQGMKYDKCGGVTVAATMLAVAQLKLQNPVIGIIAAAENMVSSQAYRPDDIITTLSGKTIEIISTDAEGRLVLADALTYAQRTYTPAAIIDLATLTGGVVVALGRVRAGLMSNDDELAEALFDSGEATSERLWRLPLDEDFFKLIKGDDADLKNSGGREGHCILGGKFLEQFIEKDTLWAHLDIANVSDVPKDGPYSPKGATGFGIRLLIHYLENN